jgi:hypothetical protein
VKNCSMSFLYEFHIDKNHVFLRKNLAKLSTNQVKHHHIQKNTLKDILISMSVVSIVDVFFNILK